MTTKLAGTMAAALMVGAATGGTESVLTATDGNRNAYGNNAYWSKSIAPANDSSKAYDFVVKNGHNLFSPEANGVHLYVGGASLQFGDGTTDGNFIIRGYNRIIVFSDLRLYGGYMSQYSNGGWLRLDGPATVYSSSTAPYRIIFSGSNDAYFNLKLSGGDGNAVKLSHGGQLYLVADQSATYSGSWVFANNTVVRPMYSTGYGSIQTSAQAFGKAPATFNPKGVVMGAGSMLRTEFSNRVYLASDNRGLWLDAADAKVSFFMNNANYGFGWPIGGEGTFALTGSGSFLLSAACNVPIDVGANVQLRLETGAELNGGLASTSAGTFCIRQTVDADGKAEKPIRIGCNLAASLRPIAVGLSQFPAVAADIPVAVLDKSVAANYAEADFDPWGVADAQIANADRIVFSADANGDTVVSVRVFPFARSNATAGQIVTLDNAGQWTPNGAPSAGNNYVVWNNNLRTGGNDWQMTYAVSGEQWVMYNTGSGSCTYQSKHFNTTFGKLRLLNGTGLAVAQTNTFRTQEFSGNYDIRTTKGSNVAFAGASIKTKISATLTGRGAILIQGVSRDPTLPNSDYSVEMAGDASGYVGTVDSRNSSPTAYPMVLKAAAETNFGGNPERFAADALKIGTMVALTPTAAMTIDDENRGVTFANKASVDTTLGDVTIKTPVVFEGAFTKFGEGTFAFGAGGVTFSTGASIVVNAGTLKAEGVNALKGVTVSFADGAVLAFDAAVGAVDLTTTTLSKAGDKYLVRIDGLQSETAIATFASAQAAADFVANAKTVKGAVHKGYLFADGATVKAGLPGAVLIFR